MSDQPAPSLTPSAPVKVALYRCCNARCSKCPHGRLIFDFELPASAPPVCPSCGLDMRTHPHVVIRRKVLHYDPPHPVIDGQGERRAACDPALKWAGTEFVGFTGSPADVTCPACRQTAVWCQHAVELNVIAEYDLPLHIDPAAGTAL